MYTLRAIFLMAGSFALGVIVDRLWIHFHIGVLKRPINPLPTEIPPIREDERNVLQLYLQEWQVIINTQMHFNDLILRFRAITLTAFVTLIGAAVAIGKYFSLSESSLGWLILTLPVTLWSTAFIIDFFYYHRLLLGSVTEALKFDGSHKLKSYGLFGMTTCISEHVHPPASKALVALYYAIPVMVLILLSFFVF